MYEMKHPKYILGQVPYLADMGTDGRTGDNHLYATIQIRLTPDLYPVLPDPDPAETGYGSIFAGSITRQGTRHFGSKPESGSRHRAPFGSNSWFYKYSKTLRIDL